MQITKNILNQLKKEQKRHFSVDEIFSKLSGRGISRKSVVKALAVLEDDGRIIHKKGAGFRFRSPDEAFMGIFKANRKGHGFVSLPGEDVFIPASRVHGACHGDTVRVRLRRKQGHGVSREAQIVEILIRANQTIIGRFERRGNSGIVIPVNDRIFYEFVILSRDYDAADTGDIVEIEVVSWPLDDQMPKGRVMRVIGRDTEPGMDITMIVMAHSWPQDFTEEALAASKTAASSVSDAEVKGRLDLRNEFTVTIDGLDAKDFDDAISLTVDDRGYYRLGVHIADVSYYVSPDSPLDNDARIRATSMYLPDRVIPMLPPKLSNGICSLKPGVDRLAVSVIMELDRDGGLVNFKITPSVIQSDSRLTYEEVDRHLAKGLLKDVQVDSLLRSLQALCRVLEKKRLARGSLNFETIEPKLVLDKDGRPLEILIRERTTATQMIEETMILTNETVAEFMLRRNAPMIFRVHDRPDPDAVFSITKLISELGYPKHALQKAHPRAFQALIDFAHSRPERLLINSLLLRAMNRAKYSPALIPHFGLAAPHYTHFTSPIRRYPDLLVHRLIKAVQSKTLGSPPLVALAKRLEDLCEHCSFQERVAESASREAVAVKVAEYMQDHIGNVSAAVISGVTQYGLFVQLENSAEGLVHIRTIADDYYKFEPEHYSLKGKRTGQVYRLGQTVNVKLVKVSVPQRQLDFVIAQ
ncbi:MAG TPA: ribonuclease R [Actinobacteria bacterium]|nr:ribonuclease R [Actinomycetota bacterium]